MLLLGNGMVLRGGNIGRRLQILAMLLAAAAFWQIPVLVVARRCYICGEGAEAPFRTTMTTGDGAPAALPRIAPTCEDFERDRDEMDQYVHECPPTYTSCLTQVDGDMELRTCGESLSINDCKSANKIDYCYCNEDLCNSLKRTQIRREIEDAQRGHGAGHSSLHLKQQQHEPNNSDDEDLSESSGMDPESHEKHLHHARGQLPAGHDATTQLVMTLKPIPTTERRNDSRAAVAENETYSTGAGRRWLAVEPVCLLALVVGASLWRLPVEGFGQGN